MSKKEKKLEKFRNNPRNVRYEELESLLLWLGFQKRQGSGSHAVFSYPGYYPITVPIRKPFLLPIYVKQVIEAIDEIGLFDED